MRAAYDTVKAGAWHENAMRRQRRCTRCAGTAKLQVHHVIDKSWLRKVAGTLKMDDAALNDLVWDDRNAMVLCTACHEAHESAYRRVRASYVPREAWEFASHVNGLLGTEAASVRLERAYPS